MAALLNGALALIPIANWHHGGPGWWLFFPLFWILVIVAIFVLLRRSRRWGPRYWGPGHYARRETAAELLERRFAAGEISSEEYRERRSVLDPPEKG
jgi:putative membrane protein